MGDYRKCYETPRVATAGVDGDREQFDREPQEGKVPERGTAPGRKKGSEGRNPRAEPARNKAGRYRVE
jgi:hypothetical protein